MLWSCEGATFDCLCPEAGHGGATVGWHGWLGVDAEGGALSPPAASGSDISFMLPTCTLLPCQRGSPWP